MGYNTTYTGKATITPPYKETNKLNTWLQQRHYQLNKKELEATNITLLTVDNQPIQKHCWNVIHTESIPNNIQSNFNNPFPCPSLWSDIRINNEGTELYWPGTEKTYAFAEWINFLIKNIFKDKHTLNGEFTWQGEREEDTGLITISNSIVTIQHTL